MITNSLPEMPTATDSENSDHSFWSTAEDKAAHSVTPTATDSTVKQADIDLDNPW